MSIARLAIRLAAREALRDVTIAEDRVFDSAITEVDLTVLEKRKPLIIVTTDDEEAAIEGRDLMGPDASLDLVIECALATVARIETGGPTLVIPDTDAGLEVSLDLMCFQILRALQAGETPWAELFRTLVPSISRIVMRRGADARQGVRFAARQIVISCKPLTDPQGMPAAGDALDRFLVMLRADPALAPVAAMIEAVLGGETIDLEAFAGTLGLTSEESIGIGTGSIIPGEPAPPITEGRFGVTAPWDDATDIAQQLPDPPDD